MNFKEYLRYLLLLIFAPSSLKTMEWRMLRLLNHDRRKHDLPPVRMQEDLRIVARKHSKDMAAKDYFDHVNFKAQSHAERLKMRGISDVISGENLAKIGGYLNPTQVAEVGLMNSPGHRANILHSAYNAVGIGVIKSRGKIYYFTQNFAKRDLIFTKTLPRSCRWHQEVIVKGFTLVERQKILYQIKEHATDRLLEEKILELKDRYFSLPFYFKEVGIFTVFFYVYQSKKSVFTLANEMQVKVRKGFFF